MTPPSRRLVDLDLRNLDELPHPCRQCVFWELDADAAQRAVVAGDPALDKEAWISAALLEWGACGTLAYVGSVPAAYVLYAPPASVPRSRTFPTSPVSADAVLLMTAHVLPPYTGQGLGRSLVQAATWDLLGRGVKALEAFGTAAGAGDLGGASCVLPADFLTSVGFTVVRPHHRYPRLRLDLADAISWNLEVQAAIDRLLTTRRPVGAARH